MQPDISSSVSQGQDAMGLLPLALLPLLALADLASFLEINPHHEAAYLLDRSGRVILSTIEDPDTHAACRSCFLRALLEEEGIGAEVEVAVYPGNGETAEELLRAIASSRSKEEKK